MENKENEKVVLLGLTTTDKKTWRDKIKEIDKLRIKELALFPTCIDFNERKEMYNLLEKTSLEKIPHVHLRSDFKIEEIKYLITKYHSEVFNTHADLKNSKFAFLDKYKKLIYIENQEKIEEFFWEMVEQCGGVCLDFSHWEDQGMMQNKNGYDCFKDVLNNYKIGCCHISAIKKKYKRIDERSVVYSRHRLEKISEIDYIRKYIKYLPKYVSIELENSLTEQLEVKKYLEKIINDYEK